MWLRLFPVPNDNSELERNSLQSVSNLSSLKFAQKSRQIKVSK